MSQGKFETPNRNSEFDFRTWFSDSDSGVDTSLGDETGPEIKIPMSDPQPPELRPQES